VAHLPVSCRALVKTLQDRPRLIRAKLSTVANLTVLPRPTQFPTTRLPTERHIYSVLVAVTLVRSEADADLHLVLEDGPAHMIAESPTVPACTVKATAYRRRQMRDAPQSTQASGRYENGPGGNSSCPLRIEINKPEFLHDLCDYLSRHGFVAVRASLEQADVLVPDAGSELAALLLLKARIRAWAATHPGINVRVDQYA